MEEKTIYIEIDEGSGTPIFAPMRARHIFENYYEISAFRKDFMDSAIFKEGTYVYCLMAKLNNEEYPVAYKEVSKSMVEYLKNNT